VRYLAVIAALLISGGPVYADTFTSRGKSYRVVDGDTVARGKQRMRILGIDAPETRGGSCPGVEHIRGREARQHLVSLLAAPAKVTLRRYKKQRDKYGREVVQLWAGGRSVAALMIKAGHAVAWKDAGRTDWCQRLDPSGNTPATLRVRG
jgi:endonuclease YncB( thermonuclease family)